MDSKRHIVDDAFATGNLLKQKEFLAEREGFEPSVGSHLRLISSLTDNQAESIRYRRIVSATM
jgi:hypothetical protein